MFAQKSSNAGFIDRNKFLPVGCPLHLVPLQVYPTNLRGCSDQNLVILNAKLRMALQERSAGGALSQMLYLYLSEPNFTSEIYRAALQRTIDLIAALGNHHTNPFAAVDIVATAIELICDFYTMVVYGDNPNLQIQDQVALEAVASNADRALKLFDGNPDVLYSKVTNANAAQQPTMRTAQQPQMQQPMQQQWTQQQPMMQQPMQQQWQQPQMQQPQMQQQWQQPQVQPQPQQQWQQPQQPMQGQPMPQWVNNHQNGNMQPQPMQQQQPQMQPEQSMSQWARTGASHVTPHQQPTQQPIPAPQTYQVPAEPVAQEPKVVADPMAKGQQEVLNKFFDGILPEGTKTLYSNVEDGEVYAFPIKAITAMPMAAVPPVVSTNAKGDVTSIKPHVNAYSSSEESFFIAHPNGDFDQLIVKKENKMNEVDHIPPGAKIVWAAVGTEPMADREGAYVLDTPVVGTASNASKLANFQVRTGLDDKDVGKSLDTVVEYTTVDAKTFFVEKPQEIVAIIGNQRRASSLPKLVEALKGSDDIPTPVLSYVDKTATRVVNDYLFYSMGLKVSIDSLLEDFDDLIEYLGDEEEMGPEVLARFKAGYGEICREICTASKLEDFEDEEEGIVIQGEGDKVDEKRTKLFNSKQVVICQSTQTTELPWTFEALGVELTQRFEDAVGMKPCGLVSKASTLTEFYEALETIYTRAGKDVQFVHLTTTDHKTLSVHKSAYDDGSFTLVME